MPQIINTNIASLTAQRNLDRSQSANATALERLSSGLRINSAKDDAAGLAISTRFESQTRGLAVAIRNAGDGIALAQTAEGALGSITDSLQRIRELAVQSANATNSDADRQALNAEAEQLIAEVTRVSEETNFNGRKLLDGSFNGTFQVGANAGENLSVNIAELTAEKLGAGVEAGVSALGTDKAFSNGDLVINGVSVSASSATDDTASTGGADRSAIAKAAAINAISEQTGVVAEINSNVAAGSNQVAGATDGSITLNGTKIEIATGGLDVAADRASVVEAINAKSDLTGVTAIDTGDAATGINLQASDGRNIELRYDKFDDNGDSYANAVTSAATGLAAGGGSGTGIATSASISGVGTVSQLPAGTLGLAGGFDIAIDGEEAVTVTLSGSAATTDDLVASLQSAIDNAISNAGLNVGVTVSESNGIISLASDSTGPGSSLVIDSVTEGASSADLSEILGLSGGSTGAVYSTSDYDTLYFESNGDDGVDNTSAQFTGAVGLLENDGTARSFGSNGFTAGDVTFSIEVDGGLAVGVTIGAELAAPTTLAEAELYAAKVESAINAALAAEGQSKTVDVTLDDGYRLVISSMEEGSDSSIRISEDEVAVNGNANKMGIYSSTQGANPTTGNVGTDGVENASQVFEGSLTLRSVNGEAIEVNSGSGDLSSTGLQGGTYNAGEAFAASQSQTVAGAIATSGQAVGAKVSSGGIDSTVISNLAAVTIGFEISVDGGDDVSVTAAYSTGSTELDSVGNYLNALEAEINAALTADGQTASVNVSLNSDNQLVIESNTKGDASAVKIGDIVTTGDNIEEVEFLGLQENLGGSGASGAVATQGVITTGGQNGTLATNWGEAYTVAAIYDNALAAETIRVSVDGGKTIDVDIANVTVADADAQLSYVETTINEALSDAGQTGSVSIGLNDEGYVTITSNAIGSDSSIEIVDATTVANSFSLRAGLQDFTKSDVAVDTVATPDGLDSGDLVINGVAIEAAQASTDSASYTAALSSSGQASGISMAAAINLASNETGVSATVNTTVLDGGVQVATAETDTPQQGSIIINGVETSTITTNGQNGGADDRAAALDAINAIAGKTGVTAVDNGQGIELRAEDGRNISIAINNNEKAASESSGSFGALTGAAIGLNVVEADISGGASFDVAAQTQYSSVTLNAAGAIEIEAGQNGGSALDALGLRSGSYGANETGTFLADIDISTIEGANAAIKAIDNALGSVASQRADLGALQNRFESTASNLAVTSENLTAANSRIRDADFAAETAELSRTQVLQQAGISILAQANQRPQQVLSLLG